MKSGEVVAGRFEILRLAGRGGMGSVFQARDTESGAFVALKFATSTDARVQERFAREAQLLIGLEHPGIVRYIAHGTDKEGRFYLAMEWLDGEDLGARLQRKGLTMDETLRLGLRVAEALAAAHARGIVHRDIKPSNLFLAGGAVEDVRLLDFGIARLGQGRTLATRTGIILGTPEYMAPEQAQGRSDVDARADVFSLGCVLFECLTGKPAFWGEHLMAVLSRILLEDAPRVRSMVAGIPEALDDLVAAMLAKDVDARPRDAAAIVRALASLGDAPAAGRAPPTARAAAITAIEQRLLCIVIATLDAPDDSIEAGPAAVTLSAELVLDGALRARRDPGQVGSSAPSASLEHLAAIVSAHGGKLLRLAGGGVLAVHTGGGSAGDLAARAARVALAMRDLLPNGVVALATGRGVLSGQLPVGEAVDSASRILSIALAKGEERQPIRLDDMSAGLLERRFDIGRDSAGAILVCEHAQHRAALLGRVLPCVGREREIGAVSATFSAGMEEAAAVAVLVTGAPGIGKSRLAAEIVERLSARHPGLQVWSAHGDPVRAGSPFSMLSALIRGAARIEEGASIEERQAALRRQVAKHVAAAEVDRVCLFLAELSGAPYSADEDPALEAARADPILMGDHMRRAFEDWLDAECAAHPTLLFFDDLQGGDLPTVRFVDAALRHLGDRPFGVLALARPEVARVFPDLWAERALTEVRLQELPRRSAEQMVRLALGTKASAERVTRIVDRAAGNPLFLEELIRAMAEGRGDIALPPTLVATVQTRLEQLSPEERHYLRAAAVFGEVFWPAGVVELLGGEGRAFRAPETLRSLVQKELVSKRQAHRRDQEEHGFRSALVREAAYATLTDADRALGHRLAAGWLEARGETDARVLAAHFDLGGEHTTAAEHYARAASVALGGNDFAEAIACVERAIACGASGETEGVLRLRQAEAHRWRGEFADAERRGLQAITLLPRGSDAWMGAVGEMATILGKLGRLEQLSLVGEDLRAYEAETDRPPTDARVVAISRTSVALLLVGKQDLANALHNSLEKLVPVPDAATPLAAAAYYRARAFRAPFYGETGLSGRFFALSAAAFERGGDVRNACLQRANVGASCLEVGDYAGAIQALHPTIAEAERMGAHHIVSSAKRDLGVALARSGQLDEAMESTRAAITELEAHGDRRLEGIARADLAWGHLAKGALDLAEQEARTAVERLEVSPAYQCPALAILARILVRCGRPAEALPAARRSVAILDEVGALEEGEGLARLSLFEALRALGQEDEARTVLLKAATEIERRAAAITDPEARRMFLENIPEHTETLALCHVR